jgi:hypothetical protein
VQTITETISQQQRVTLIRSLETQMLADGLKAFNVGWAIVDP